MSLADYTRSDFTGGPYTRAVYRRGTGPAVIVMHEMPGLHPLVVRFADTLTQAGLTVFMPVLFGTPGRPLSRTYFLTEIAKTICLRREFVAWAGNRSSPIVEFLRALARHAHEQCGGRGVGAVGMCFTGNFALAMMTEPSVVAPVLSQPSLPATAFGKHKASELHASPEEIACARRRFEDENLSLIGLRFRGDALCPQARFDRLSAEFGDRFEPIVLEDEAAYPAPIPPHSVLTLHLDTTTGTPTERAQARVIEFLTQATRG